MGLMYENFRPLKELFERLYDYVGYRRDGFDSTWEQRGPVLMCNNIASELWLQELPETDDTRELRRQVKFLNKHCHWDFQ